MDQSTNKTCPTLGAILFYCPTTIRLATKPVFSKEKVRTNILLADLVCFQNKQDQPTVCLSTNVVEIAPNRIHQKKNRTDLGKCTHLYDEPHGNKETQALLAENCLRQVQEDR